MSSTDTPVIQIIGDGADGQWLTWRWNDGRLGVHKTRGLAEAMVSFKAALPRPVDSIAEFSGNANENSAQVLTQLGLGGQLTQRDKEFELLECLSKALIPDQLREELVNAYDPNSPRLTQLRVMPSPEVASVPWGLLPLTKELRILDVADVSWIAPLLPQALADPELSPSDQLGPALLICNPHGGSLVIDTNWQPCQCGGTTPRPQHQPLGISDLKRILEGNPKRLLLVGHCSRGRNGDTGIKFTNGSLLASTLVREAGQWGFPGRVGVVACASGTDLVQAEPFGLATGLLLNGAQLAQLTLWVLPTDAALGQVAPEAGQEFSRLAQAMDHALASGDVVRAVNDYQRERLKCWREKPSLATSPLVWGAAFVMTAPLARRNSDQP